jgi:hypothetical protein
VVDGPDMCSATEMQPGGHVTIMKPESCLDIAINGFHSPLLIAFPLTATTSS